MVSIIRSGKAGEILIIWPFGLTCEKSVAASSAITAGQDAPPTGLVLYGFAYNLTVVQLSGITDGVKQALKKSRGNRDFYRVKISIALAIHSLDSRLQAWCCTVFRSIQPL